MAQGELDESLAERSDGSLAISVDEALERIALDHGLEHHVVRSGCLMRRGVDDTREGPPIVGDGQRMHERAAGLDLAQRQAGPPGAQTRHALEVVLVRAPRAFDPAPAESLSAPFGFLRPIDAEEHAAALVVFGQQDVCEGDLVADTVVRSTQD